MGASRLRPSRFVFTIGVALILFAAPLVYAEMTGTSVSAVSSETRTRSAEPARIQVFVFRGDAPVSGVRVSSAKRELETGGDGLAELDFLLPADVRVSETELQIGSLAKPVTARLVPGETTVVFVNLIPDLETGRERGSARLEEPPVPSVDALLSQGPRRAVVFRVISDETGEPVSGAQVFVQGLTDSFKTDERGYAQAQVPIAAQSLVVIHERFTSLTFRDLKPSPENGPTVTLSLRPASTQLEDFEVLAPQMKGSMAALIEIRRRNTGVAEVLGSEQMARAGDGDAASSLRRVTGLTLVGGKYVYVRGLGERYSSTLLNGASLPSPEPARRVVPLDLFPTSILESMVIQKSYSPELPGEFGGGAIQMVSRGLPEKSTFRIAISQPVNPPDGARGYRGGRRDWLGRDDGTRALPQSIRDIDRRGQRIEGGATGLSERELQRLGASFTNSWASTDAAAAQLPNLNLTAGQRLGRFGYQLAGLYGTDLDFFQERRARLVLDQGDLRPDAATRAERTEREIRTGLTADFGVEITPNQKVYLGGILVRSTTDLIEDESGFSGNDTFMRTRLEWAERQIVSRQIRGENQIGKWQLGWRASRTDATRDAPDNRSHGYILRNDQWLFSTGGDLFRNFSTLNERADQVGADLKRKWSIDESRWVQWTAGFDALEKRRSFQLRRFDFQEPTEASGIDLTAPVEELFAARNFERDGGWTVRETTRATDSYRASQAVSGTYTSVELAPSARWEFSAGARYETSQQDVVTFNLYDADRGEAIAGIRSRNLLPVYGAKWKFAQNHQLRLTYAETLSRPDLKELSTAPYFDDQTGFEVKGNPALRGTVIRNWDARWEWYPGPEESVSFGVFQKNFESPIELILVPQSSANSWTFRNALNAVNLGAEIEARRSLRFLSRALRRWTVGSNIAVIQSRVRLDEASAGVLTTNDRPLQGQSPYVANLQVYYDHRVLGLTSGLLYNVVGRRIREVASAPLPDVYEEPFHQLDFVSSMKISEWRSGARAFVQFRARNLLDPDVRLSQGDEDVRIFKRGRIFTVGLSATL